MAGSVILEMFALGGLALLALASFWSMARLTAPRTEAERVSHDEDQMEALRQRRLPRTTRRPPPRPTHTAAEDTTVTTKGH